jgi:hypothetical protein
LSLGAVWIERKTDRLGVGHVVPVHVHTVDILWLYIFALVRVLVCDGVMV